MVSKSQTYENDWINYGQQYFKVKVWQNGIYRISGTDLQFSGVPIGSIDPRKVQVFHNGQEEYIHLEGESDGVFNGSDFIEFFGSMNDGSMDTRLYSDSTWQPQPQYSLYTDTAVYFITWSSTTNGRRLTAVNDNNYPAYTPASYFIRESYVMQNYGYNRGMNQNSIDYTESEGWCGVFGNYQGTNFVNNVAVNTANVYSSGPNVEVNTCVGGVNNNPHNMTLVFPGTNFSDTYYMQSIRRYNFSLSPALFTSSSTTFTYNVSTPLSITEYSAFYWLSVRYPHTFDLEAASTFELFVPDDAGQTNTRMDISNFNAGTGSPILYDLTNHRRILVSPNGPGWQALVPNDGSATPKRCFLSAAGSIQNITSIKGINYVQSAFGQFNNLLNAAVDSAYIIITHRALWNQALAYKNYRNITTANRVVMVDIDELYDQFSYGIQKHPLSIRNFVRFALERWTGVGKPQHILLLGKSMSPADFRQNPTLFELCLVPSYGVPTSDMLLVTGLDGTLYEPSVPIGRICARTGNEILDYLAKVQEFEQVQSGPPQTWMKEILHFGGGNNQGQQDQLAGYLSTYEQIMEDSLYGGHVTTYLKNSNDPIVINQSDTLQAQIDNGVSIMTFFGHASGSGFDQSTDEPSEYNNQGKYPLIVANSCFAGDIHTYQKSVSEKFVLEPSKAAIAFIASVGQGIPEDLYAYSTALFQNTSRNHYGATIGQLMKYSIQDIQAPGMENIKIVCNEMSLNGDPALRLNVWTKPDYMVDGSSLRFNPAAVTTDLDTFSVVVNVRNLAKAVSDSFTVRVTRTYPDGSDSVYTFQRGNCFYNDEFSITMTTGGFSSAGLNLFRVEVDLPDSVDEYDNLTNNSATTQLFINSNDIIPVYPARFAIHPYNSVTLKASTANPLADVRTYRFEIDTIDMNLKDSIPGMQNSPLYRFTAITDSGGVLNWSPPSYILQDSVVYYWRVTNDSIDYDPVKYRWQQSSFQYIPGKSGWSQSHFHQFMADGYQNVRYDTLDRYFDFIQNNKTLRVLTKGQPGLTQTELNEIGYSLNNVPMEYNGCQVFPAVMVAVLDSITLDPWTTCAYNVGQFNTFTLTSGSCDDPVNAQGFGNCRQRAENYFIFQYGNAGQMTSLNNFLASVPDGNYIIAYSWFNTTYSTVDPNFHNAFASLNFNTAALRDNAPFIYFTRKGYSGSNQEVLGVNQTDTITFSTLLSTVWNRGYVNSSLLGPARSWESLHWNQRPVETGSSEDIVYLNVLGLNSITDAWDTLVNQLLYTPTGKDTVMNWISATTYPYLKLQTYLQDDSLRTPPQMDYWRVYYEPVPECALNPNRLYTFYNNPLQEGDTIRLQMAIDNLSNVDMDSLSVAFYRYGANRSRTDIATVKLDSLRENQYLTASIVVDSTFGLAGNNSLWIEANPYNADHQAEQYHFNNIAEVKFNVERDRVNPILDVTFDGVHILDGDIVSGKPNIIVRLHDENRFLALNDTSKFKVYLRAPGAVSNQLLSFTLPNYGQAMRFTPAVLPLNSARIDWNPVFETDGIYELEVEAADRSNNESGRYNYKISFEVINRSTITEVLNYPNPFSTSTRFVFTLTGSEIPTNMKIQIMTISGKIVREIMKEELGNIHIGRNITDYAWDGKDEFGDQLANGLYLYRVITNLNGETIEKRATDADKYFKKGWGKMYLMR